MKVMKAHQSKLQLGKTTVRIMNKGIMTGGQTIKKGLEASVIGEEEHENEQDAKNGVHWQCSRRYLQRSRRGKGKKTNSFLLAKTEKSTSNEIIEKSKSTIGQSKKYISGVTSEGTRRKLNQDSVNSYHSSNQGSVKVEMAKMHEAAVGTTGSRIMSNRVTVSTQASSTQASSAQASLMQAASMQTTVPATGNTMTQGAVTASKYTVSTGAHAAAKGSATVAGVVSGAATAGVTTGVTLGVKVVSESAKQARRMEERIRGALTSTILGATEKSKGKKQSAVEQSDTRSVQVGGGLAVWGVVSLFFFFIMTVFTISISLAGGFSELEKVEETDIIEVARTELEVAEENLGGYKYKNWYGMDANWCAMFVSWCANECGYIEEGIMPKAASVSVMQAWYIEHDLYQTKESGYCPKKGDIIIFKNGTSHVGIVESYDAENKIITTIEGNTGSSGATVYHKGSRVKQKTYAITHARISGYGTPEYDKKKKEEESEENSEEEETEESADTY